MIIDNNIKPELCVLKYDNILYFFMDKTAVSTKYKQNAEIMFECEMTLLCKEKLDVDISEKIVTKLTSRFFVAMIITDITIDVIKEKLQSSDYTINIQNGEYYYSRMYIDNSVLNVGFSFDNSLGLLFSSNKDEITQFFGLQKNWKERFSKLITLVNYAITGNFNKSVNFEGVDENEMVVVVPIPDVSLSSYLNLVNKLFSISVNYTDEPVDYKELMDDKGTDYNLIKPIRIKVGAENNNLLIKINKSDFDKYNLSIDDLTIAVKQVLGNNNIDVAECSFDSTEFIYYVKLAESNPEDKLDLLNGYLFHAEIDTNTHIYLKCDGKFQPCIKREPINKLESTNINDLLKLFSQGFIDTDVVLKDINMDFDLPSEECKVSINIGEITIKATPK